MKPKHTALRPAALALCLAALPAAVWADDVVEGETPPQVTVSGKSRSLRTENRDSYGVSVLRSTTGLILSPREIPQSVTVITKDQIADQGITRLEDALKTATGINVF